MTSIRKVWWDTFRDQSHGNRLDRALENSALFRPLETATSLFTLSLKLAKSLVTPPYNWLGETVVEVSRGFRQVAGPMMVASLVYVLAFGSVLFGRIVAAFGTSDRLAGGVYIGLLRELGTWLTYMVLAAVLGAALAGDLGARKIREELDALDVLGVDKIRSLILPRVVAMSIVGLTLSFLVVLVNWLGVCLLDTKTIHVPFAQGVSSSLLQMNPYDIAAAFLKHTILGVFIGVVACQKGLTAKGGAEGVGRAVAETVLITFFGIWLINSLFNTAYLTVVPEAIANRG